MKYRYVGAGEYHTHIPARDLAAEDFAALDAEQQVLVQTSPLYEAVPDPAAEEKESD